MRAFPVRLLSAAFLFLASSAHGATLLVNGAAGCSDTTGAPYCTINKAILAASPGDTIQIAAGTYAGTIAGFSKPLIFTGAGSGTSGTVITKSITYTGTGPLAFSSLRIVGGGTNLKVGGTGNFSGLTLTDAAFVGNGSGAHGLFIKQNGSVSGVSVTNCSFTNHGQSGMLIQKGTGPVTAVDDVSVSGSTFDGNGEYGLRIDPRVTNLQIANSSITNNAIDGFLLLNADGVSLDTVTITGNRNGILLIALASTDSIANVTLTNVTASNNTRFISGQHGSGMTLSGGSGSITAVTATNSTFSSNSIHGVAATGAVSNVSIGCSVIAQNGQHGVFNASSPDAAIQAERVYWGCASGPGTAGCSTIQGSVDFSPYRSSAEESCTAPVPTGIAVTPATLEVDAGETASLTATLTWSDGTTTDVTATAEWTSSNSAVATVDAGVVTAVSAGTATITATASGFSGSAQITVPEETATLTAIAIQPAAATLIIGQTRQLIAVGTYSDGSTANVTASATWSSSDNAIATVSASGNASAVAAGTATITAAIGSISGTAELTVVPQPTSLVIAPAFAEIRPGETQQFTTTAHFADGTSRNVTNEVAWTSGDPESASINAQGLATGIIDGYVTIIAVFGEQTAYAELAVRRVVTQITVTPDPFTVVRGAYRRLTATATYDDGTSGDVTNNASWTSSAFHIISVDSGRVYGVDIGEATITAELGGFSDSAAGTVSATGTATSLTIEPAEAVIPHQEIAYFNAYLNYSDGSYRDVTFTAQWTAAPDDVVSVHQGAVYGSAIGSATVTASSDGFSASVPVTVVLALSFLDIEPEPLELSNGTTGQLTVNAVYSDDSTVDVTAQAEWSSDDPAIATVSSSGLVTAVAIGSTYVSAEYGDHISSVFVEVFPEAISLSVEPASLSLQEDESGSLAATVHFADGSSRDVTQTATWTSSNAQVASVDEGAVQGEGPGTATVTATAFGRSGSAAVSVSATLLNLAVTPPTGELLPGGTLALHAFKHSSDGTSVDVTAAVTWSTDDSGVASVNANGVVTAHAAGQARVKAFASDVEWSALAHVIVRPALASIAIAPQPVWLTAGATRALTVEGTYADEQTGDVTSRATWSTSNAAVATVGATGRVTGVAAGTVTITATVEGETAAVALTVEAAIPNPPDPAAIAPPIDPTRVTTVHDSTRFLYEGSPRVQTGVAPGTIVVERAAVLRGRVLQRGGAALAGAKVTVLGHPELGQTFSRTDGRYDLAVNGGGPLTLHIERGGYMSVQRQVPVAWNTYGVVPDVAMTAYDANVTTISAGASAYQVARGSVVSDDRGTRRETLLFTPGTQATMLLPDGTTQSLSSLSVRATEYTVGSDGLEAMPAPLPVESGYTYCVELSADEAVAAGASTVRFDRQVITYIDEFVGIPVGTNVPNGYYDRERGVWVAAPDGRVIMIMAIVEGRAYLDVTGDGNVDDAAQLDSFGITTAEREQLGSLYGVGQKLWRVPVDHFTPFDHNIALFPLPPWDSPGHPTAGGGPPAWWIPAKECKTECGSIVDAEDQTLGEQVGVQGTPFRLSYTTRQMPGFRPGYRFTLPLTGTAAPRGAKRVEALVVIAGRPFQHSTSNSPNQKFEFEWDGLDVYGRPVQGAMMADVALTYTYDGMYVFPGGWIYTFADYSKLARDQGFPAPTLTQFEARRSVNWQVSLGNWQSTGAALGAWTLDVHHTYDPVRRVLHKGDGSYRNAEAIGPVVETIAGTGCCGSSGDDGPAKEAALEFPNSLAVGPDGSLYVGESNRIRRIGRDGIIRTVAGDGSFQSFEDGRDGLVDGPAKQVPVSPKDLAIASNGSIYVSEGTRIRRLSGGRLTTVAGSGRLGSRGDDGSAAHAGFASKGIAASRDGSLLVVDDDSDGARLRRVSTSGQVATIAGADPDPNQGPDGPASGRAVDADLGRTTAVASGPSGKIYLTGPNETSRRISPEGTIENFGPSDGSFSTDFFGQARPLAVDERERVFWGTQYATPDGDIQRFVGGGSDSREGALALGASIGAIRDVAVGPDGSRYVIDHWESRIKRVAPSLPGLGATDIIVPSDDASEEYIFNDQGRHLQTRDAVTGTIRYRFEYDAENRLVRIIDVDDEVTTIERDANGKPLAIVAPGGQRSPMTVNGDGYLTQIANAAGEAMQFTYWPGGLLKTFTDPMLNSSTFTYDSRGRLVRDADAAGGRLVLARTGNDTSYSVVVTTGENRTRSYTVANEADGTVHHAATTSAGLTAQWTRSAAGATSSVLPGGILLSTTETPDPRFGMQSPLGMATLINPSGLSLTTETTKEEFRSAPHDLNSPLQRVEWTMRVNGHTSTAVFDVAGRTLVSTSPMGRISQSTFDDADRLVSSVVPGLADIDLQYDAHGRLVQVGQGPRVSTYAYDSRGRMSTVTDPLDRTVTYTYDEADRVTRHTLMPSGRFIDFTYDDNGNLTSVKPPERPAHNFGFTPVNLTDSYAPPSVPNGGPTFYEYDRDRRLRLVTRPDSRTVSFGYDGAGRVSTITVGRGEFTFDYSAVTGHLQSAETPEGHRIAYSYDGALRTAASWSGEVAGNIFWGYDNDFRLTTETVACATATSLACEPVSYGFDADGLLMSAGPLTLHRRADNGLLTGTTLGEITDAWTYNDFAEPLSYSAAHGSSAILDQQYTRDDAGRIIKRIETIQGVTVTTDYTYDDAARLRDVHADGVLTARYTYDENGNRLTRTGSEGDESATVDDQDRLLTYNEFAFDYTANGELRSRTDPHGTTTFEYDELGNLLKVVLPDGRTVEYVTDAENRRVAKKVDGVIVRRWIYAGALSPAAELDADGNVVARYIYGPRRNVPAAIIKGSSVYRVVTDSIGSPRLVVDSSTGAVMQRIDYDEFGRVLSDSNPEFQPFRFAGGFYDPDVELIRFGARDYDPYTGRWTAKDPILFAGGSANVYNYVDSDPINFADPTGLQYSGPYPPPPPNVPGGPWEWNPNPQNGRGGTYNDPSGRSASWDEPGNHWDVDQGDKTRVRYDNRGNPLTKEQAHGYKGPKQKPIDYTKRPKGVRGVRGLGRGARCVGWLGIISTIVGAVTDALEEAEWDDYCSQPGADFCDCNPDLCA
jgi:RHS repeat-associated protein